MILYWNRNANSSIIVFIDTLCSNGLTLPENFIYQLRFQKYYNYKNSKTLGVSIWDYGDLAIILILKYSICLSLKWSYSFFSGRPWPVIGGGSFGLGYALASCQYELKYNLPPLQPNKSLVSYFFKTCDIKRYYYSSFYILSYALIYLLLIAH